MSISAATVAVWLAFAPVASQPQPSPQPAKCCSTCNGTGYVLSGDGLARIPCPCPPTCACKGRTQTCTAGTCSIRR